VPLPESLELLLDVPSPLTSLPLLLLDTSLPPELIPPSSPVVAGPGLPSDAPALLEEPPEPPPDEESGEPCFPLDLAPDEQAATQRNPITAKAADSIFIEGTPLWVRTPESARP
jgi:hypothetical protein